MIDVSSVEDLVALRETVEVECKRALGRDGQGQVPTDLWPTYSAFANTRGGAILLGLREKGESFELAGIPNPAKVRRDLFNELNNPQKVSANLLNDNDVIQVEIDGRAIIIIRVPAAGRTLKPVYINNNPNTGTYRRLNDGDRLCDPATVHRMLAEQLEDSRDNRILTGFGARDLNPSTVNAFRQALQDTKPAHPYLEKEGTDFLYSLGAFRRDRQTSVAGLTIAGLLMFGRSEAILEEFPDYFLDYQERSQAEAAPRWVDRITIDGTWSGNLYDFYRRVYRKLTADLKVPFMLKDGRRKDESPVHEAIREGFVNALVHADYTEKASILVVKRPDMLGFRNPGLMRVSVEQAIKGGESDGRNRTLQKMFLLIGVGERAGSGVPRIHKGWLGQHWRPPALYQKEQPSDQTLLELHMIDLLPPEAVDHLRALFGNTLDALSLEERLTLATAATEGKVTHGRVSSICTKHPVDITRMLQGLVQSNFLIQIGRTKGAVYYLPGTNFEELDETFLAPSTKEIELALNLTSKPEKLDSAGLGSAPAARLDYPLVDELTNAAVAILRQKVLSAADRRKRSNNEMRKLVLDICAGYFVTAKVLSNLLDRNEAYLRNSILAPLVSEGLLIRAFQAANNPRQAYTANVVQRTRT